MEATTPSWWQRHQWKVFALASLVAVLFGFRAGNMMKSGGSASAEPFALLTLVVILPAYVLVDSLLAASRLWCPVRAFAVVWTQGWAMAVFGPIVDPIGTTLVVAIPCAALSFVVTWVRGRRKRQRIE